MLVDLPEFIHCKVNLNPITGFKKTGFEDCYIFAVTCIPGRTPLFTAHLQSGAVFSRLPLWMFRHGPTEDIHPFSSETVPWSCIGEKVCAVKHAYLKDYEVQVRLDSKEILGRYLMTLDYFGGNFSEDPEQHKTHNIIELVDGTYAAVPNNYCRFLDSHYTLNGCSTKHYRRSSIYWKSHG